MLDGLEDSDGGVQLEVGTVHHFFVSRERHHPPANLYVVCTKLRELLCQDIFKSHEGLGDEFKFLFHY